MAEGSQAAVSENILELESGHKISYVAPAHAAPTKENSPIENGTGMIVRKSSSIDGTF